jgi:CrcB protein
MDELLIGLFAIVGGVLRWLVGQLLPTGQWPLTTLLINLVGSFLLAWLSGNIVRRLKLPAALSLALGTGMIGAFTTFSTLTLDVYHLILSQHWWLALTYIVSSIIGGTLMAAAGMWLGSNQRREASIDD